MAEDVGGIKAVFRIDMRQWSAGITRATRDIRRFSNQTTKFLKKNEDNFRKLGRAATVAAAAIGAAMFFQVKAAADLEQGYIEVAKRTGFAGDELKAFAKELEIMSVTMRGISIKELQQVAATAGQLGIEGVENILGFARIMAEMGVATDLSAHDAAISMARLLNVMGEDIKSARIFGSVLNELSNNTTAYTSDLVHMTLRMGASAKSFGLTSAEVLALAASMRDAGVRLESGGSGMLRVFEEMLKNVEGFAEATGLEMEKLGKLLFESPIEALKAILVELSKMDKIEISKALEELGLSGVRVIPIMRGLSGSLEHLDRNLKIANDEAARGTSLQIEYEKAAKGLTSRTITAKNQFIILGKSIGFTLMPEIKELTEAVIRITFNIKTWVEENQELVKSILIFTGKIGLAAVGIVALGSSITVLRFTLIPLVKILWSGVAAIAAIGATSLAVVGGVIALGAAAYALRAAYKQNLRSIVDDWQTFADAVHEVSEFLGIEFDPFFKSFAENWVILFKDIKSGFGDFIGDIAGGVAGAIAFMKNIFNGMEVAVDAWAKAYDETFDKIKLSNKEFVSSFGDAAKTLGLNLKNMASDTGDTLADLFAVMKTQVGEDMDALIAILREKMPAIAELFDQLNKALPKDLVAGAIALRKATRGIFKGLAKDTKEARDTIRQITEAIDEELLITGRLNEARERSRDLIRLQIAAEKAFGVESKKTIEIMAEYREKLDRLEKMQDLAEMAERMGDSFANAFEDAIFEAKKFNEVIVSVLRSIAREMMRTLVTQPLARGLTSIIGNVLGGSFGQTTATVKHAGGEGFNSPFRTVPSTVFANAPRLHAGLQANEFPAILEQGETVISKDGGINVVNEINIINETGRPVDASVGRTNFDGERYITDVVIKDLQSFGPMRTAIQGIGANR